MAAAIKYLVLTVVATAIGIVVGSLMSKRPTGGEQLRANEMQRAAAKSVTVPVVFNPQAPTSAPALPAQTVPTPSEAEEDAARLAAHDRKIEAHKHDAIDPVWAPRTRTMLTEDLNKTASAVGFTVRDVDCRMTTCTAAIDFDSYLGARKNWMAVLHTVIRPRCGVEVTLDDPKDIHAAFTTQVFYSCIADRAEGSP